MKISKGFTLFEILLVVFIVSLVAVTLSSFQRDLWRNSSYLQGRLIAESEARDALRRLIAELRSVAQGNDGSYPLAVAGTSTITFFSDIDNDGQRERLRYFLTGGNLVRGTIKPSGGTGAYLPSNEKIKTVVHDIANATSSLFHYYSGQYDGSTSSSPLPTPVNITEVRLVEVRIMISNDQRYQAPLVFESRVTLRNLKDNQ